MSTPTDPAGDPQQPTPADASTPSDAPTQAYPDITPDAPTQAYPPVPPAPVPPAPADGQPVAPAYAPAPQAPYGQPAYAQPAYAATPAPAGPDTRPKTLAWISLGLAVLGTILACVGFVPVAWVGLVSVIVGGLVLLVAFILSIVALANRKQGGKPIGIIALVLSVLGTALAAFALIASIVFSVALTATSNGLSPAPSTSASAAPEDDGTDEGTETEGETPGGTYDETAFLAEVRPAILAVFQEVDPSITEDMVELMFPDESLITVGQSILLVGEAGRSTIIDSFTSSGEFTDETAGAFFDAIYTAAEKHLQE